MTELSDKVAELRRRCEQYDLDIPFVASLKTADFLALLDAYEQRERLRELLHESNAMIQDGSNVNLSFGDESRAAYALGVFISIRRSYRK